MVLNWSPKNKPIALNTPIPINFKIWVFFHLENICQNIDNWEEVMDFAMTFFMTKSVRSLVLTIRLWLLEILLSDKICENASV